MNRFTKITALIGGAVSMLAIVAVQSAAAERPSAKMLASVIEYDATNPGLATPTGSGGVMPESSDDYQHDDAVSENALGLTAGGEIAWIHHFNRQVGFENLTGISTCFGTPSGAGTPGVVAGAAFRVYVWSDPNGDGMPADAVLLAQAPGVVAAGSIDTDVLQKVAIGPIALPASFFIGASVPHAAMTFPAPMDQTATMNEAWVNFNNPVYDPNLVGAAFNMSAIGFPADWLLRANAIGAPVMGACCLPGGGCTDGVTQMTCEVSLGGTFIDAGLCGTAFCKSIGPGLDCWETGAACNGETSVEFGGASNPPIPANFFGPGSLPFMGQVDLLGGLSPFDTQIQRMGPLVVGVGACDTVPIQIVALDLVSCAPIMVSGGPAVNGPWDVAVGLSNVNPPPGMMTACKDSATAGTFDATFNVQARFTFTKAAPPGMGTMMVLDTGMAGQPPVSMSTVGSAPFLQPNPTPIPPCDPSFGPGLIIPPMSTQPCCPETCHENPGGDHLHCTRPPDCNPCPEEPNDDCLDRLPIPNGPTGFMTLLASTDGPDYGAGTCGPFGDGQIYNDIWYNYTATCSGTLTVTTCEELGGMANFDTRISLHDGWGCPPGALLGCNDDDPINPCGGGAGGFHSTLEANVIAGGLYKIRVGGFDATQSGTGTLNITCAQCVPTGPEAGNCNDDIDNDCDFLEDCVDPDCTGDMACLGAIPTVSEWGILVLSILLVAAGTVVFARRRSTVRVS